MTAHELAGLPVVKIVEEQPQSFSLLPVQHDRQLKPITTEQGSQSNVWIVRPSAFSAVPICCPSDPDGAMTRDVCVYFQWFSRPRIQ
jgi:hypothetical protein